MLAGLIVTAWPRHAEAQAAPDYRQVETIPLWPSSQVPYARGDDPTLDVPTIDVWLPDPSKATGSAVVVCPGGGYGHLAVNHEGKQVAEWLNSIGVAAFVLKYRLGPRYHHPAMLTDAARAIRLVRHKAARWKIDPHRVAIMGFSAGGHLASTAGTHFDAGQADAADPVDRLSSRPDRLILVYPVIALATPFGHTGSLKNLLGENPTPEQVASLSNETQVTADTPPTFLAHTNADTGVPAENSILFALALRKAKVPVELHLFEKGRHGLGLGSGSVEHKVPGEPSFAVWPKLCETWLKNQGFLDKTASGAKAEGK
jgi:acetyl esterase/lipase